VLAADDGETLHAGLWLTARLLAEAGAAPDAVTLWATVTASMERAGVPLDNDAEDLALHERARASIGDAAWDEHWAAGSALSNADAVAVALRALEGMRGE
jgi:hypothetical protein